jgi:hypothetical protein
MLIEFSKFSNLQGLEGGAIFLTSSSPQSIFIIRNSTFKNNSGMHGGAVKLMDGAKVLFSGNYFINNSAKLIDPPNFVSRKLIQSAIGGAINLNCDNGDVGLSKNCDVNVVQNNYFINNSAKDSGGGIIFLSNLVNIDSTNNFTGNTARYGHNVASYPSQLQVEFINNGDYFQPYNITPRLINEL